MKKLIIVFAIMFAGLFKSESNAWQTDVNFNFFYHNLNPYGEWIEVDYDLVVWKPYNVHTSWSPYSVGNWEYTSYGWYWESYEPFGWATYHYGRWYYDDFYGWVWIPGYEWGPSWVEWRYSDAYIGWSPLPPYADFRISVGIYFSHNYRTSYHYWNFVTYNRFCHRNVNVYFINNVNKNYVFNNTKYRTNYYSDRGRIINGGVDRNFVERRAGTRILEREVTRTTDLRDYTNTRGSVNSNRVVAYQPGERDVQKYRNQDVRVEKRASSKSNLRKDLVTFRNEENKSRSVSNSRAVDISRNTNVDSQKSSSEVNESRIYKSEAQQKSNSRYRIDDSKDESRSFNKRVEQPKRETPAYRKPAESKEVSRSVSKSVSRSDNKNTKPSVDRSQSSSNRNPVSINRNKTSSKERSVSTSRSNNSSNKSTSRSKGKRK